VKAKGTLGSRRVAPIFGGSILRTLPGERPSIFAMSHRNSVIFLAEAWLPRRNALHGDAGRSAPLRHIAPSAIGSRDVCCGPAWGE
jgi:hypothetical protein